MKACQCPLFQAADVCMISRWVEAQAWTQLVLMVLVLHVDLDKMQDKKEIKWTFKTENIAALKNVQKNQQQKMEIDFNFDY